MGRDKALIHLDGRPLAEGVALALTAAGCERVIAVGGDADALSTHGMEPIPDLWPRQGPLGGLGTALAAAGGAEVVVIAPCDLLAPESETFATLVDALRAAPPEVVAAVPLLGGRRQWIASAWRPRDGQVDAVAALLASGRRRLDGAVTLGPVVEVTAVAPGALRDADTPDDLGGPVACGDPATPRKPVDVPQIDIDTLAQRLDDGATLIDVREPGEHAEVRVPGAVLIPLGEVAERADEVPADRTVYLICARGGRSQRAAEHLQGLGRDVVNVAGGTLAWVDSGRPTASGPA